MMSSRRQFFPVSSTVDCFREAVKQVPSKLHTLNDVHDFKSNLLTPRAKDAFRLLRERFHCYEVPERRNLLVCGEF